MFVKVNNRGLILIKYKGFCKSQPQGIDIQNINRVFVNIGTIGSLPLLAKGAMLASSFWP